MENLYCTIFIVDISQNPDESETVSSRIQQLVEDHGGIIKKINRWGKKRMAYSIQKKSHGFYVEIEFSASSRLNIPKILETEYRINDRVLRHLTYIVDKKELIQREKNAGKFKKDQEAEKPDSSEESKGKTKTVTPPPSEEKEVAESPVEDVKKTEDTEVQPEPEEVNDTETKKLAKKETASEDKSEPVAESEPPAEQESPEQKETENESGSEDDDSEKRES